MSHRHRGHPDDREPHRDHPDVRSGPPGRAPGPPGRPGGAGTDSGTRGHRARVGTGSTRTRRSGGTRSGRPGRGRSRTAHAGAGERVVARTRARSRTAHAGAAVGVVARTWARSRTCGSAAIGRSLGAGRSGSGRCRRGRRRGCSGCRRSGRSLGGSGGTGGCGGRNRRWGRSGGRVRRGSSRGIRARLSSGRLGCGLSWGWSPGGLGCCGLGREGLTQLALNRGLDRRGRRLHILTVRVEPRHGVLAGNTQLLGQCADPDLRHFSPRLGPSPWCLSGHGPLVAGGHAHSSELIECSFRFAPQPLKCGHFLVSDPASIHARTAAVSRAPWTRRARGSARRRSARSRQPMVGCRYAPRPGCRNRGSGRHRPSRAVTRSRSVLSARVRQATQVRVGLPCWADGSESSAEVTADPNPHSRRPLVPCRT